MKSDNSEIIIYQTTDGLTKIDVRMQGDTVWLTQAQMAQLFGRERSVITKHIRNIFAESELDEKSNVQILHIATTASHFASSRLRVRFFPSRAPVTIERILTHKDALRRKTNVSTAKIEGAPICY
ncbi:MAG: hypothetical protein LBT53_01670 [Puniceicoccales bacterium]|jgi:hypothetical protein|nr:hypothetical protein [Puniceicoccales bacterium]